MTVLDQLPVLGSPTLELNAGGVNVVAAIVASLASRDVTEGTRPLDEVQAIDPFARERTGFRS